MVWGKKKIEDRMETKTQKISSFTQLYAWQKGHKLVLLVYGLTNKFPKHELFSLVSQLRRALISITSNIVEGFGRRSMKEKVQFYYIAAGSLTEVQNQLLIARDLSYITNEEFQSAANLSVEVAKLLNGLISKSKLSSNY
jgi:four helix bundle protein